jgi:hypothetical protein
MRKIIENLTSIYTGEIQKILDVKIPQETIHLCFHRLISQPNLSDEQMIRGFINILFISFPKQSQSNEKRHKLMLLLNEFPKRYKDLREKEITRFSHFFTEDYYDKINKISPIDKKLLVQYIFNMLSGKQQLFFILDKIGKTMQIRQELDKIFKEIKTKYNQSNN